MAALQLQFMRNFFGDFDARINELTGASERWENAKIWILENFQTLLLVASALIFPAFVIILLADHWDIEHSQPVGCKRVGSNQPKDRKVEPEAQQGGDARISPISGCKPIVLLESEAPSGYERYDRQFGFATPRDGAAGKTKDQWQLVDRKEAPRLSLVDVQLWVPDRSNRQYNPDWDAVRNGGCLIVSFPFVVSSSLSFQYLAYIYSSAKARYIRRSWSAQPKITFEVPCMPTKERMSRKAYPSARDFGLWEDALVTIDMTSEVPPDTLAKLRRHLGIGGELRLFRKGIT